jgi:hypothetical protein
VEEGVFGENSPIIECERREMSLGREREDRFDVGVVGAEDEASQVPSYGGGVVAGETEASLSGLDLRRSQVKGFISGMVACSASRALYQEPLWIFEGLSDSSPR